MAMPPAVPDLGSGGVPPRVSLVTLGVADVARAAAFYAALGWRASGASTPEVVFFHTGGVVVALWGEGDLAADGGAAGQAAPAPGFRGSALAINLASAAEVDAALDAAVAAGGTLARPAQATDWGGYNGYFADPDGHLWEVAHNPFWPLRDDGSVELPP
jgi:predicted lactoylglutathione lyase